MSRSPTDDMPRHATAEEPMPIAREMPRAPHVPLETMASPRAARWWRPLRSLARPDVFLLGASQAGAYDAPPSFDGYDDWCRTHAGERVVVRVCSQWIRHWALPAGMPLPGTHKLMAQARADFLHYFGVEAQQWSLAASSDRGTPIVVAMPGRVVEALQSVAAARGVTVHRIQPWWVDGLARLRRAGRDAVCVLVACEPRIMTGIQWEKGRVTRIVSGPAMPVPGGVDAFAAAYGLSGRIHVWNMEQAS